jgi:hypothetical protein
MISDDVRSCALTEMHDESMNRKAEVNSHTIFAFGLNIKNEPLKHFFSALDHSDIQSRKKSLITI